MHESSFHFLCCFSFFPHFVFFFSFRSKSHIIIRLLLLMLLRCAGFVCGSSTARMNVKREAKEIYWEKFRFSVFFFLLFSNFLSHVSLLTARIAVSPNYLAFFFRWVFVGALVGSVLRRRVSLPLALLYHNFFLFCSTSLSEWRSLFSSLPLGSACIYSLRV